MLMKYKDFKILSQNEMKAVKGGFIVPGSLNKCATEVNCPDGHTYTCSGDNGTFNGDGSSLGCASQTNVGATCYYLTGFNTWASANIQCNGSRPATISWALTK
jgi:bacteriocin-like protein